MRPLMMDIGYRIPNENRVRYLKNKIDTISIDYSGARRKLFVYYWKKKDTGKPEGERAKRVFFDTICRTKNIYGTQRYRITCQHRGSCARASLK